MAPYIPEPRDTKDAPICRAIESQDWKTALKLVEKRLTKDNSPWLQALRCFVQCSHPAASERQKGAAYILQLGASNTQVFQVDELHALDAAANKALTGRRACLKSDVVCQARAAAVKANPKDENLALDSLRACLKANDLGVATEILPVLEKNFPEKRQYAFWSIVISYLWAQSDKESTDESDVAKKTMFLKLAHMKLTMFAKATRAASEAGNPLPPKSLQTPQELLLLYAVTYEMRLEGGSFYDDVFVGPTSPIGKGEWALQLKKLQSLRLHQNYDRLFTTSYLLLANSCVSNMDGVVKDARGADWKVWEAFLESAKYVERGSYHCKNMILKHLRPQSKLEKTYLRNAHLAKLEWIFSVANHLEAIEIFNFESVLADEELIFLKNKPTARVLVVIEFLHFNAYASSAFDDVKYYVESLTQHEQCALLELAKALLYSKGGTLFLGSLTYRKDEALQFADKEIAPEEPMTDSRELINTITAVTTLHKLIYFCTSSFQEVKRSVFLVEREEQNVECKFCHNQCAGEYCEFCLEILAESCLELYVRYSRPNEELSKILLPTDRHPADGLAIIASMALLKIAESTNYKKYTEDPHAPECSELYATPLFTQRHLQVAALLDNAHQRSLPNPDITLLLQQIYFKIGAGSLAMDAYRDLNLKQIQRHTLGYLMFDRISTLHPKPQPAGSSVHQKDIDPAKDLEKMQEFYRNSVDQTNKQVWKALENGSYDVVLQLMDFKEIMSDTRTSAMVAIESRRVARLLDPATTSNPGTHGFDLVPTDIMAAYHSTKGTFDYESSPDYEVSDSTSFREITAPGPDMDPSRMIYYLINERLYELLAAAGTGDQDLYQSCLSELRKYTSTLTSDLSKTDDMELMATRPEVHYCLLVAGLADFIVLLVDPTINPDLERLDSCKQKMTTAVESLIGIVIRPRGGVLPFFNITSHPIFVMQETEHLLVAVSRFLAGPVKLKFNAGTARDVPFVVGLVDFITGAAQDAAKHVKAEMNEPRWLDRLVGMVESGEHDVTKEVLYGGSIGARMSELLGVEGLEAWASRLLESYHDSVDGMVKICKQIEL